MRPNVFFYLAIFISSSIGRAIADDLDFLELPFRPGLNSILSGEFGTAEFPPLADFAGHYYRVAGSGPTTITFQFQFDGGLFTPEFGYYRVFPDLIAIDTSTDDGKIAYATMALAPGNAELVFADLRESPVRTETYEIDGGELIGFFSIPRYGPPQSPSRSWLEAFQTHPEQSALNGRDASGSDPFKGLGRWPFFSYTPANPGGYDQMFSLHGFSNVSGQAATMLLWEDASEFVDASLFEPGALHYDGDFNDEVYVIEGIVPVPEPSMIVLFVLGISAYRPRVLRLPQVNRVERRA